MSQQPFNFDEAPQSPTICKDITSKNGILMPLIKQLTESAISAEIDHHLSSTEQPA